MRINYICREHMLAAGGCGGRLRHGVGSAKPVEVCVITQQGPERLGRWGGNHEIEISNLDKSTVMCPGTWSPKHRY